jgi:transcription-repair coupling factor (superfamily II helicase)
VENLLQIMAIKQLCKEAGIEKVDAGPKGAVIGFRENKFANPAKLIELIQKSMGQMKVRPDQKLVLLRDLEDRKERVVQVTKLLVTLAGLAKSAAPGGAPGLPPVTPVLAKKVGSAGFGRMRRG